MINKKNISVIIIILVLVTATFAACAAANTISVGRDDVIGDDVYTAGQTVRNDGVIKGDFISAAQNALNDGTVEGDFIGVSGEMDLAGRVLGDARCAGGNIVLSGIVGKNANVFGGNIDLQKTSQIGRNLLIAGSTVTIDGKVEGSSRVYGGRVTLKGEFMGDVEVSIDSGDSKAVKDLIVEKDAVIHGKLIYRGMNEAVIQEGAKINGIQWEKLQPDHTRANEETPVRYLWKFVRTVLTALLYFVVGLLLYKLFPACFVRPGKYISEKPLNTIGAGLVAIIAVLAAIIVFIVLMLLSIALISPSVGLVFGCVTLLAYILLFYLSTIPVSVWLGSLILKDEKYSDIKKFGAGLAIITVGFFALGLLAKIPAVGIVFGLVSFILTFVFLILGVGALIYILRDLFHSVRNNSLV